MSNDSRKILFVGGIPATMSEAEIEHHFKRHCKVSKVRIMREKKTLEPKGFAFVTLADATAVSAVLKVAHVIAGRKVDVQLASRKGEKKDWKEEQKQKRLFVSNLPNNLGNEELAHYFSQYGQIRNAYIIKDFMTDQSKNYGYIEFEEVGVVHSVLKDQVTIRGHKVVCLPYVGRHEPRHTKTKGGSEDEVSAETIYKKKGQSDFSHTSGKFQEKVTNNTPTPTSQIIQRVNSPSKYEFIGMSNQLNQDESNYRFQISGVVISRPATRFPVPSQAQVTYEKTAGVPSNSIARYRKMKACKHQEEFVSLGHTSTVAAREPNVYSSALYSRQTVDSLRQLHRDLLR
jgi:hypothetical protein